METSQVKKRAFQLQLPSTFRALRHRNYLLWFTGQGISLVGTWMQTMAQQVLVYRLTGSAAALGTISFIGLIPVIPLSLWGGSISDRFPKRTIILFAQIGMLAQAFILAWLTWSNRVEVWHVYILSFFLGALTAIDLPARQAFTIDLVEGKSDLANAIGLNSAMFNGARAIGPALAGLVVATTGEGWAFFVNGLSFVAVIICLLWMRNLPDVALRNGEKVNTIRHLQQGLTFVRSHRTMVVLISLIGVSAFLSMPYNTLMPVYADNILASSAQPVVNVLCSGENPLLNCISPEALPLGILLTMIGIGALLGALYVASLPTTAPYGKLLTLGNLAFPLLILIMAFSRSFIMTAFVMLLVGISFVLQNALANTLMQLYSPDELRGRVMSLYTMVFQTMMRMGSLQAGYSADALGAPISLGIGAGISLAYGLFVAVRYPDLRK
jgi:MFS family permease